MAGAVCVNLPRRRLRRCLLDIGASPCVRSGRPGRATTDAAVTRATARALRPGQGYTRRRPRADGGIGRRARLRAWSGITGWRFESSSAHSEKPRSAGLFAFSGVRWCGVRPPARVARRGHPDKASFSAAAAACPRSRRPSPSGTRARGAYLAIARYERGLLPGGHRVQRTRRRPRVVGSPPQRACGLGSRPRPLRMIRQARQHPPTGDLTDSGSPSAGPRPHRPCSAPSRRRRSAASPLDGRECVAGRGRADMGAPTAAATCSTIAGAAAAPASCVVPAPRRWAAAPQRAGSPMRLPAAVLTPATAIENVAAASSRARRCGRRRVLAGTVRCIMRMSRVARAERARSHHEACMNPARALPLVQPCCIAGRRRRTRSKRRSALGEEPPTFPATARIASPIGIPPTNSFQRCAKHRGGEGRSDQRIGDRRSELALSEPALASPDPARPRLRGARFLHADPAAPPRPALLAQRLEAIEVPLPRSRCSR